MESDQSEPVGSEVVTETIAPVPLPVSGVTGPYITEVWTPEETMAPGDLAVVSSTAPGTAALTGIVLDEVTGDPVLGASVTLQPSAGGSATTYVTGPNGGYAFINIPAIGGATYDLTVSATNFGAYRLVNDPYTTDETYQRKVRLCVVQQQ
jgi:hypothetical protein